MRYGSQPTIQLELHALETSTVKAWVMGGDEADCVVRFKPGALAGGDRAATGREVEERGGPQWQRPQRLPLLAVGGRERDQVDVRLLGGAADHSQRAGVLGHLVRHQAPAGCGPNLFSGSSFWPPLSSRPLHTTDSVKEP